MPVEDTHMLLAAHLCSAAPPTQCHSDRCTGFHEQLCWCSLCFSQVAHFWYMVAGYPPCLDWYCWLFLSGMKIFSLTSKEIIDTNHFSKIKYMNVVTWAFRNKSCRLLKILHIYKYYGLYIDIMLFLAG